MKEKTYRDEELDAEITVAEMTRAEALEYAMDFIDVIEVCGGNSDMTVYIEYKDGSYYLNSDGEITGTFKKSNIKAIELDDSAWYYIYGKYTMNEYLVPELI